jgi:site-specific recombinase XerD
MNNSKFTAILRKDRANEHGQFAIYLYGRLNKQRIYIALGEFVPEKSFSKAKQKVYANVPRFAEINNKIEQKLWQIESYVNECNYEGREATQTELISRLKFNFSKNQRYSDFIESHFKEFSNKYSHSTLKSYRSHKNKIDAFNPDLKLNEINRITWKRFEQFLREQKFKQNTIHKHAAILKKFMRLAVEFGLLNSYPLEGLSVKDVPGNRVYLPFDEVQRLQELYLRPNYFKPREYRVLRYFLFACYTGLRYSDIYKLRFKDIEQNKLLNLEQQKTKNRVSIPLSEKAKTLLPEIGLPNAKVFPVYSNQKTNQYLKDIMKRAQINKNISFHCARHTFATNTLELTGNIALVSSILGHTAIKTTQLYAKATMKAKVQAVALWDAV